CLGAVGRDVREPPRGALAGLAVGDYEGRDADPDPKVDEGEDDLEEAVAAGEVGLAGARRTAREGDEDDPAPEDKEGDDDRGGGLAAGLLPRAEGGEDVSQVGELLVRGGALLVVDHEQALGRGAELGRDRADAFTDLVR